MTTSIDSASAIIERIAFLDAMSSQLSTVSDAPWDSTGFMFAAYLGITALFIVTLVFSFVLFDKKARGRYVSLALALLSGWIAFTPAQPDKVAQLVKIDAAIQGMPPAEILFKWTDDTDFSTINMPSFVAVNFNFDIDQRISNEKSALELELARIEFIESGELEKLKRELIQSALKANESGQATPEQLALLRRVNQ